MVYGTGYNWTTYQDSADWLDTGDNAWQLTAGSLVALQSVPGLVVL
jgi:Amt family ammonium transporter